MRFENNVRAARRREIAPPGAGIFSGASPIRRCAVVNIVILSKAYLPQCPSTYMRLAATRLAPRISGRKRRLSASPNKHSELVTMRGVRRRRVIAARTLPMQYRSRLNRHAGTGGAVRGNNGVRFARFVDLP